MPEVVKYDRSGMKLQYTVYMYAVTRECEKNRATYSSSGIGYCTTYLHWTGEKNAENVRRTGPFLLWAPSPPLSLYYASSFQNLYNIMFFLSTFSVEL